MKAILERLLELQDTKYADFQSGLTPTLSRERFIGVRTPELRRLAKEMLAGTFDDISAFMSELPHSYFEENQLHAFLISGEKDFSVCMEQLERFLPYIDNWATCDQLSPGVFKNNSKMLLPYIERWLASSHIYTVRFGIGMLMRYFLDDAFDMTYAEKVASIPADRAYFCCRTLPAPSDKKQSPVPLTSVPTETTDQVYVEEPVADGCPYYIRMMIAWYFATALAKQYDRILPFIEENRLDPWIHNKTIQKAVESYRITPEQKAYLKTLRIK
ncbi:MAG: DNA alkylation repair protein [Lachnospiraceae bacterium]|nr:DNA alkylation repair protein [Lachnospiraceae bacterium]